MISAIVASIVSLIGFIVNYRIAKENRKTALEELKTQSRIRIGEQSISGMGPFLSESESLRFSCLKLIEILENINHKNLEHTTWKFFFQLAEEYNNKQSKFFSCWFKVIHKLRNVKTTQLAELMHEGNNYCAVVSNYLGLIRSRDSKGEKNLSFDFLKRLD